MYEDNPAARPVGRPDTEENYRAYSEQECTTAMQEFRAKRKSFGANRSIPKTVKFLRSEGYDIELSDYKIIESRPAYSIPHVRAGILIPAYKSLESRPTVNQDRLTFDAMQALQDARETLGMSRDTLTEKIFDICGYQITPDEYRTCEQGTTKRVPLVVVLHAAVILGIQPEDLFREVHDMIMSGDIG